MDTLVVGCIVQFYDWYTGVYPLIYYPFWVYRIFGTNTGADLYTNVNGIILVLLFISILLLVLIFVSILVLLLLLVVISTLTLLLSPNNTNLS